MKVNYYVAFKTGTGANPWSDDALFKRAIYEDAPLDETLDTGIIVDVPGEMREIKPFTLCRIRVRAHGAQQSDPDVVDPRYYWTGDVVTEAVTLFGVGNEISNLAGQTYRHKINLIELTKILEREPCDSLSFTHRLRKDIVTESDYVEPTITVVDNSLNLSIEGNPSTLYLSPITTALPIYSIRLNDNTTLGIMRSMYVEVREGNNVVYSNRVNNPPATGTVIERKSLPYGDYTIEYGISYLADVTTTPRSSDYEILYSDVSVVAPTIERKPVPSITDVVNRILSVGSPRPAYKDPKYHLDGMSNGSIVSGSLADKLDKITAPEFFFPRMTLFEALLEVGKKIHAIPRLVYNESTGEPDTITYDFLGLDEEYSIPSDAYVVGYKKTQATEDYCGALDSYVDNHINTVDPNAGTITEPFDGGFKTLRCESGVKIINSTAVFEVSKPIYRVIKFEMGFAKENGTTVGDITPYVYEQAEYDGLLTSDSSEYPDSVKYALVWKQGDRYIRGFNTVSESLLNLVQQFNKPAINNIVEKAKGDNAIDTSTSYANLAFRLTYIPMDNLRLRQYKPYDTHPNDNLLYNQQNANTVEGSFFGESLKGKILRMGNAIEVFTIRYADPTKLPKLGQLLVDDNGNIRGYVYKVTTRSDKNWTVADVYTTPDFNRLSEYFSLESNFRLFEVSERQSIDRQVMVPRIISVSLAPIQSDEPSLIKGAGVWAVSAAISNFMGTFIQDYLFASRRPTVAAVRLLRDDMAQVGSRFYALPVNSTACGNSLAFSFSFLDSFSAGGRSIAGGTGENDVWTGQSGITWKQKVNSRYGTAFGEFYYMEFGLSSTIYTGNADKYSPTYSDQSTAGGFCDSLPTITTEATYTSTIKNAFFTTGSTLIDANTTGLRVVDKNSSEHISVVVQFHGRALDKRIVFGSAMWKNNLLIRDEPVKELDADGNPTPTDREPPCFFGLTYGRLNMLRNTIDVSPFGANQFIKIKRGGVPVVPSVRVDGDSLGHIESQILSSNTSFSAWCIADPTNGEIYIGVNEAVKRGESTSPIYFNFDTEA